MQCPGCGHDYPSELPACPKCGAAISEYFYGRAPLREGTLLQRGAYKVGARIGLGANSIVYSGLEVGLGHPVAIKEFFPINADRSGVSVVPGADSARARKQLKQARAEFLEEGRLLARFTHPGIVRVHAAFEENETAYLVMELLEGETLYALATGKGGKLPQDEVLRCAVKVAAALETIHLYGLVHADLKPENLMLTRDGRVVLLDFGAANRYLTGAGKMKEFTPAYAAPEQASTGGGKLGPYTDVYGLAATLYHVLAGRRPIPARTRASGEPLENLHPRLRPDLNPRVAEAIRRALELDPRSRPDSMRAFMDTLGVRMEVARPERPSVEAVESFVLQAHKTKVVALDTCANGHYLASGSEDGQVYLWDLLEERSHLALTRPGLTGLRLGPDASWLAVCSGDGSVMVWDVLQARELKWLKRGPPRAEAVARTPNGAWLGAAYADGTVDVWKSPGKTTVRMRGHKRGIYALALSPDGQLAATGSGDQTVRIWDTATGACLSVLNGHQSLIQGLAFSPDGELLASSSMDRSLRLWDPKSGQELRSFHGSVPLCTAISPDGQLLAAGSADKSIRLYDVAQGRLLGHWKAHDAGVTCLVFLPSGRLASGSADATVRVWEVRR